MELASSLEASIQRLRAALKLVLLFILAYEDKRRPGYLQSINELVWREGGLSPMHSTVLAVAQ